MNLLILTPTTDTVWFWLIAGIVALIIGAGLTALWEEVAAHIAYRRQWARELEADRHMGVGDLHDTDEEAS